MINTLVPAFDGRPLTPGETFTPFPEAPHYTVTFHGTENGLLVLSDHHGVFARSTNPCTADHKESTP